MNTKKRKRMKLPNGFGSIIFLHGSRRRPWAVLKTINGRSKYIGYFPTHAEALIFLADCNKDPSIYLPSLITFGEAYQLEMAERKAKIASVTVKNYEVIFGYCKPLHNKPLTSLKVADLQAVIKKLSDKGIGHATQKKVRQLYHNIYNYAVKYQIIPPTADISRFVDVDLPKRNKIKQPFNTRQLNRVKALADSNDPLAPYAMIVIMMCYSGPRPSEFLAVEKNDVKLHSRFYRIRESKTEAGRNRLVPISKKVVQYYDYWLQRPGKTLITDLDGKQLTYHCFLRIFDKVMEITRCKHKPHECRHTCATWLDDKGANKLSIKKILGHATQDITDGIYTHKNIRQLKKAIDLL